MNTTPAFQTPSRTFFSWSRSGGGLGAAIVAPNASLGRLPDSELDASEMGGGLDSVGALAGMEGLGGCGGCAGGGDSCG